MVHHDKSELAPVMIAQPPVDVRTRYFPQAHTTSNSLILEMATRRIITIPSASVRVIREIWRISVVWMIQNA
jgi:hypothetical protein